MGAEGALLHSPAAPAAAAERHTRQWAAANTSRSPPPSLPRAQCGQTAVPRESSSLPSDGIGTCNGLIREQRAVIESSLCLPDLPSEPNPEQALLETGCQRSSALAHAIGRIRAAPGLLPEPSRCRAPQEGVLQPKARLLQQHPQLNTKVWCNSKRGRGGPCPLLPPKQSEVSSPAWCWKPLASGGCAARDVSQPVEDKPSPVAACSCRGGCSARRGLVLRTAPVLPWVPLPTGQRLGSALGSMRSRAQLGWLQARQPSPASSFSNKR